MTADTQAALLARVRGLRERAAAGDTNAVAEFLDLIRSLPEADLAAIRRDHAGLDGPAGES